MRMLSRLRSSKSFHHGHLTLALAYILMSPPSVKAEDMWKSSLQYHGFITQGLIKTDNNNYYGHSSAPHGSAALTEVGFNISSRFSSDVLFSAQVLSRRAGELYEGDIKLDYGLIDFSLNSDAYKRYGLRIGRFKNPLGFYNDTRDVAFTRPGIFLPQSIYFENLRNAFLSDDGILAYSEFYDDDSIVSFELGTGKTPIDINAEYTLVGGDVPGTLESSENTVISRLMYQANSLKLALSYAKTSVELEDAPPAIGNGTYDVDIRIFSAQYILRNLTMTTEWAEQPVEWHGFSSFFPNGPSGKINPGGYYFQLGYQYTPKFELLVRYERGYADKDDKSGEKRSALLASAPIPIDSRPYNFYTHDITGGFRYDFNPQLMFRAEYHIIEGTYVLSGRENDLSTTEKDWRLFSLLLSYRF